MDIKGNLPVFRHVTRDEVECKVSVVKPDKGVALFIYKTARTDVIILNETVGAMNWQCEYKEIKGNMYCGVSIYDVDKYQWVTKWDCGELCDTGDKNKGEASDAFKRACFKWGIGIELYTSPFIWIPASKCNMAGGKCFDKFAIEKIAIENHTITGLSIINTSKNNERVFVWTNKKQEVVK